MKLEILPIKTKKFLPPKDNLFAALKHLPKLKEGDVLIIASKVVAIHQGRTIKVVDAEKSSLINKEADYSLPKNKVGGTDIILTIKDHTLIPSAGIDESNAKGYYILWPKDSSKEAKKIASYLKQRNKLKKLGVIIADSHTTPLRWGTQGVSIGFYGLEPLKDYRGKKDIFGRALKYTQSNIVDSLANLGVIIMGEGKEQTPMVIIRGFKDLKFINKPAHKKLVIEPKKDLYYPLLKIFKKK
jgi:dihydrofolate synthase / folylpolyglutamate synthase